VKSFKCIKGCGYCCTLSAITILPHEVFILKRLARIHNIDITIAPAYTIADTYSRVRIALSYVMKLNDNNECPFLDKDKFCIIHQYYKPLTCRSFPYLPRIIKYFINYEDRCIDFDVRLVVSTLCPIVKKMFNDDEIELICFNLEYAKKIFPEEYDACLRSILLRKFYVNAISTLWKAGMINVKEVDNVSTYWPVINAFDVLRKYMPYITIDLLLDKNIKLKL